MRLVTWNCCRGPYLKNVSLLDGLAPDIAVIQECAKPAIQTEQCLWFGDNPRQGIAVIANGPYRLNAPPVISTVPRYAIPVRVIGPISFMLIAVWAKDDREWPYVEGVIRAVKLYRNRIAKTRTVLLGDLNSNAIWDADHAEGESHSALAEMLSKLGLVSSYHHFHGEAHGEEKQPTYYFQWKEQRPFHLDYCFIPKEWAPDIQRVNVGSYDGWRPHSDHRPLLVEITERK